MGIDGTAVIDLDNVVDIWMKADGLKRTAFQYLIGQLKSGKSKEISNIEEVWKRPDAMEEIVITMYKEIAEVQSKLASKSMEVSDLKAKVDSLETLQHTLDQRKGKGFPEETLLRIGSSSPFKKLGYRKDEIRITVEIPEDICLDESHFETVVRPTNKVGQVINELMRWLKHKMKMASMGKLKTNFYLEHEKARLNEQCQFADYKIVEDSTLHLCYY